MDLRAKRCPSIMGEKAVFSLKKGLYLFLILSASTSILIVYFTMDEGTWACLARVRYTYILAILGLILAGWSFDTLRLRTLVASLGNRISFIKSLGIVLSDIFAAAVTPSHMGGGIVQVYMLFREGVPIGSGWALSFIKLVLDLFVLAVIIPFGFLLLPNIVAVVPFKWVSVLPSLAVVIFLYYLLLSFTRPYETQGDSQGGYRRSEEDRAHQQGPSRGYIRNGFSGGGQFLPHLAGTE